MMADRRRKSPERSHRGSRKDSKRSKHDEPAAGSHIRSRSPVSYSSSSSSSSSLYLDISRTFPSHRSGLRTFFTAPSERRRLRKRRSRKLLRFNNSSSSSVNSDLAYGTGFIKKKKQRGVRSRHGKGIDRESVGERERYRESDLRRERYSERDMERERAGIGSGPGIGHRLTTDAEILAVGAGLAKLARDQNKLDLKSSRNGKKQELVAARESGHSSYGASRGLGSSRVSHGSDTFDEDGWESASDGESDSSVDSRLAFGNESTTSFWPWGKKKHKPQSRKSSLVDPRLFGRQNSLNGILTEPVGLHGDVTWTSTTDFGPQNFIPSEPGTTLFSGGSASASQTSLRQVYPVTTDNPYMVDAERRGGSIVSGPDVYNSSNRPDPVPIQHPKPFTPVSQSVYDPPTYATRPESGGILKNNTSSGRGKSIAEAALVGVAGVAVASAIADRKDDRKEKRREEEREEERLKRGEIEKGQGRTKRREYEQEQDRIKRREYEEEEERKKRRDSEKRDDRRRDRRDSPDRKDKSKDKEKDKRKPDSKYSADESRRDKKGEKRRDETREEKEKRREKRREERRSEVGDDRYESRRTKSETAVPQTAVDPFQYQVEREGYNPTQTRVSAPGHGRAGSVPTVVTVEREPDFTRRRSSSIKETPSSSHTDPRSYSEYDERDRHYGDREARDRPLHDAERTYEKVEHSTIPYGEAAIAAGVYAVAAEGMRESRSSERRNERRGEWKSAYDDRNSNSYDTELIRDREPLKDRSPVEDPDPVQERANRAYRETVIARKIASQVIHSRTPSPDRSVVGKYDHKDEGEEIIRIVTPPEMKEHEHQKGPYDAPNADFKPDYILHDPRDLQIFNIPALSLDRSNPESGYLKRDPDAARPRPHLNLVRPTPTPSPLPEKQIARSEPARSSESKDHEPKRSAAYDVVIGPKGNVVASPTTSAVSKGVTWGQNETKHFEVESPHEHKEEFVTKTEVSSREGREEPKFPDSGKGWGAVAASVGIGAGIAAASSNEAYKTSKSRENKKQDTPYEYRGVVVEPEGSSRSPRQPSPPSPGPKPYTQAYTQPSTQSYAQPYTQPYNSQSSHMPGTFDDDLDFTANVAAGLQDSGFDPNIVINDPNFRRRDSPPGSNEPGIYRAPFAETVTDLGVNPSGSRIDQGFVIGEVDRIPQEWRSISPEGDDTAPRLSKREQKKRDKTAGKQSTDATPVEEKSARQVVEEPDSYFIEPKLSKKEQKKRDGQRQDSLAEDIMPPTEAPVAPQIVAEPESYFEPSKKSKKKSKKGSSGFDDDLEDKPRNVTVPVDAFNDLQNGGEADWNEPKRSKKKSKRDTDRYDSPSRSVPSSEISAELERSSSKKSKDKSRRKSEGYEPTPSEVSLPPSTPSENSRDGEYNEPRSSRKSNRDSDILGNVERDESRFVVSTSRNDDEEPRKKKKSRSIARDDFDDTRSVASAPVGDDEDKKKKRDKKGGGFFGLFGSKSESGPREESPKGSKDDFEDGKKKSKKEKRRSMPDAGSLYGDLGAQSVNDLSRNVSNGHSNGSHRHDDEPNGGARSDSERSERKKTRSRAESTSSKKDSFLGNAGTLGAGVGIAGAAVAIAAQHHQQSKAANANSREATEHSRSVSSKRALKRDDVFDQEITQWQFRPSIDPQYGDLLPLPPSDPTSPNVELLEDLPDLPESKPGTPEADRLSRPSVNPLRRGLNDAPMKSPSQSAVPLKFIMGNRSTPSSPGLIRPPQTQSPDALQQETLVFPRNRPSRPTSWDSTREYKPLYLVESNRHLPNARHDPDEELPELPPSQRTSRSSSQHEHLDTDRDSEPSYSSLQVHFADPLSIDTALAASHPGDLLDSQQSTPKAGVVPRDFGDMTVPAQVSESSALPSLHTHKSRRSGSPVSAENLILLEEFAPKAIGAVGFASAIGYFASSPSPRMVKENWMDDLPSLQRRPSPIDPMTKDRSSYLLNSSPISRRYEEVDSSACDIISPPTQQGPLFADGDTLHSIEEREGADIFGLAKGVDLVSEQDRSVPTSDVEAEPAEQFALTQSKKDKTKDKKQKGVSRSSTQDDVTAPEQTAAVSFETPATVEGGPSEEYGLPKSKKDKKGDKKKSKSVSTLDGPAAESLEEPKAQGSMPELSRDIVAEPPANVEADPSDNFALTKSRTDQKKDKNKSQSTISWDEPANKDTYEKPQESVPESSKGPFETVATHLEAQPTDEFSTPRFKKGKKRDKKKTLPWDDAPVEIDYTQLTTEELTADEFHDANDGVSTPVETEPLDEFSTPQSVNERESFKWEPEHSDLARATQEPLPEMTQEQERSLESFENPLSESSRDILEPTPISTSNEVELADMFSVPKSKQDKRRNEKPESGLTLEAMDDNVIATQDILPPFQPLPDTLADSFATTSRDFLEETSAPADLQVDQIEDFAPPKAKKDKKKTKKAKSGLIREPGKEESSQPQTHQEPVSESIQEIFEEAPPNTDIVEPPNLLEIGAEDKFSLPRSKKDKKKDRKRSKSSISFEDRTPPQQESGESFPEESHALTEDMRVPQDTEPETNALSNSVEVAEQVFSLPKSEKDRRDKKRPKSLAWDDNTSDFPPLPESVPESSNEYSQEPVYVTDDFAPPTTKKSKKNRGKSLSSDTFEEAVTLPESENRELEREIGQDIPQDVAGSDNFCLTESKTGRKKNKYLSSWAPEEEVSPALPSQKAAETKFVIPESKKDKKPGKQSRSMDVEESPAIENVLIPQDEHSLDSEDKTLLAAVGIAVGLGAAALKSDDPQPSQAGLEPKDGLEAGYNSDQLSLARQLQEEFAAGSKKSKKDKKKRQSLPSTPDLQTSQSRAVEEPTPEHPRVRSLSVGLSAMRSADSPADDLCRSLYSEDQLELARQLKAEFDGGSKKSKKDKKKRQGLSRSSTQGDAAFDQPMDEPPTMDLPVETPAEERNPDPVEDALKRDGFEAGYQEDQLSLARQLQAEFGKKSKKDKKRRSTSQTPLQQELRSDYFGETPQLSDPQPAKSEGTPCTLESPAIDSSIVRDGLAVRYKEEQLHLARQLKEEYGPRSKKSRKDKKLRSTSETPVEQEPRTDYFEEPSQIPALQSPALDGATRGFEIPATEPSAVPDSLAVGYNEDQLELARQLKEEFGSGFKKSKKDKKGEKRESLLRSNTEDDFSSGTIPRVIEEPAVVETLRLEIAEGGEAAISNPEDDFFQTTEKSKKDRKAKKRESLLLGNTDDDLSSDAPSRGIVESQETEAPQNESAEDPNDIVAAEPEEELAPVMKKSRKDKKGKKRDSIVPTAIEDNAISEPVPQDIDQSKDLDLSLPENTATETSPSEPVTAEPEDEFFMVTKKSKKDKKNKKRVIIVPVAEDSTSANDFPADDKVPQPDPIQVEAGLSEPVLVEPEDESAPAGKKSKKDKGKKRQSIVQAIADEEHSSDSFGNAVEALHNLRDSQLKEVEIEPGEATAPAEDDWASLTNTKKSKKNTKKRQSLVAQDGFSGQLKAEAGVSQFASNEDSSTPDVTAVSSAVEGGNERIDTFGFTAKNSEKDNKKRGSVLRTSTFDDDVPEKQPDNKNLEPRPEPREIGTEIDGPNSVAPEAATDHGFEFTDKKSKKDMKKRKSLRTSSLDDASKDLQEPTFARPEAKHKFSKNIPDSNIEPEILVSDSNAFQPAADKQPTFEPPAANTLRETPEVFFDNFAFTTKKSKKDKKGKGSKEDSEETSGFSTPLHLNSEPKEILDHSLPTKIVAEKAMIIDDLQNQDSEAVNPAVATEPEDDWAATPPKKSKDKKRKSGLSTPLNDDANIEPTSTFAEAEPFKQVLEPGLPVEAPQEPEDEWGSFSAKKSKKDKKIRKSGLSTPLGDGSRLESEKSAEIIEDTTTQDLPSSVVPATNPDDEEWSTSFTSKKSKKNQKKAKSGLSSPLEDTPTAGVESSWPAAEENVTRDSGPSVPDLTTELAQMRVPEHDLTLPTSEETVSRDLETSFLDLTTEITQECPAEKEPALPGSEDSASRDLEISIPASITEFAKEPATESELTLPQSEETASRDLQASVPGSVGEATQESLPRHEDEWGNFTIKKGKKGKKNKKSGLSTPAEEIPTTSERVNAFETSDEPLNRESEATPQVIPDEIVQGAEPQDEWAAPFAKKSKKEKKDRQSGLYTPVKEVPAATGIEKSLDTGEPSNCDVEAVPEGIQGPVPEDEWGTFSSKLPKKDKRKSKKTGLSTPVDETPVVFEPEKSSDTPKDLHSQEPEPSVSPLAEIEDEWGIDSFSLNNSKKDKKKQGSSGLPTPLAEETTIAEPEQAPETFKESAPEPAVTDRDFSQPPIVELPSQEAVKGSESTDNAPPNDNLEAVIKTSMKDKKKRKSGASTPFEEVPATESQTPLEASNKSIPVPAPAEDDLNHEETLEAVVPEPEYEFSLKKSKKDRKGKRGFRVGSESGPSTSSLITPPVAIATGAEKDSPLQVERMVVSPVPFEQENATVSECTLEPEGATEPVVAEPLRVQKEIDDFPIELQRKTSKKDKRKRQATVDVDAKDGSGPSKPPLTSWADEVEDAEVERNLPVIEEIANDQSLSRIASTTETATFDDFSRPTKKGKKGKKRQLSKPESMADFRLPIGEEMNREQVEEKSSIPALTATGAALVGAAVGAAVIRSSDRGKDRDASTEAKDTPTRKLSKDKRKKSVDRRTAREDHVFDDPSLWESADSKVHEETKGVLDDDAGSDGFWSPTGVDQSMETTQGPAETWEASTSSYDELPRTVSPSIQLDQSKAIHVPMEIESHRSETGDNKISHKLSEQPTSRQVSKNVEVPMIMETEPTMTSSTQVSRAVSGSAKEYYESPEDFIKSTKQDNNKDHASSREPKEMAISRFVEERPAHSAPKAPTTKEVSFEGVPSISYDTFSTPIKVERSFVEDAPVEHSPFRPLSSSKFSLSGFSDLPAVEEESTAQVEVEHHGPFRGHDLSPNRDSAFVSESPIPRQRPFADRHEPVRDSGVHLRDFSPSEKTRGAISSSDDAIARLSWPSVDEDTETVDLNKSQRQSSESSKKRNHDPAKHHEQDARHRDLLPKLKSREDKPTDITRRDLFPSQKSKEEKPTDLHRTKTVEGTSRASSESLVRQRVQRIESPDYQRNDKPRADKHSDLSSQRRKADKYADLGSSQRPKAEKPKGRHDTAIDGAALGAATLGFAAARQSSLEKRPDSAQSQKSISNINRLRTPDPKYRPDSVGSNRSGTPPLRRTDRKISGDLRSLSQLSKPDLAKEAELGALAASTLNTANPTANEGRARAKDMADVYDGFGEGRVGSPRSPTRPHSMRRRQSMQVLELESKLEQLAAENRMLVDAHAQAERGLQSSKHTSSSLVEKDAEIDALKRTLDWLQNEVTRLTEVNDGLTSANITLGNQHNQSYGILEAQHEQATRELQEVHDSHNTLTTGMQGIVANQIQNAVEEKDREIAQLRADLDAAKDQIREMQRQILALKANNSEFLTIRDEDYFDNACQQLCQHVQQWVLRFSKFSDMRACRLTSEINNDKTIDRLDNAILDGSDVDSYLADRIKRRDVFMSMTMTMVWEFVFTRYLFGMDREQRQKLKSLEKLLSEVGPASAVHQWRATTLTLLAKRDAFVQQREQDTQAVVHAVMETLSEILPPPSHLEEQIEEQLKRVMKAAVDLSIEMRTQRAEYMMLPPLQPEYDANGDLASKVQFNAALMNERSGDTASNEDLEAQKAVVRIVLFPLVVKKGDDKGEGDEEIVVCPAQVLVAKPKKQVRVFSPGSMVGANSSRISMQSSMPAADYGDGSVI